MEDDDGVIGDDTGTSTDAGTVDEETGLASGEASSESSGGEDACAGDAVGDSDGDGVCDREDICPDGDDSIDGDGDGVPDACDPCPVDTPDDTDGDGFCDSEDSCASLELQGNEGWLETQPNPFVNADVAAGTITTWFRASSGQGSVFSGEGYLQIVMAASGNMEGCSDGLCTTVTSVSTVDDGRWHHAALTWDNTHTALFIDGVLQGSVLPGQTPAVELLDRSFTMGKHASVDVSATVNGQIGETAMWDVILTPAEIIQVRDGGIPASPQLLWWSMTEGAGAATDRSGNNLHGTLVNGASWSGTCPYADSDRDGSPAWSDPDDADPSVP